MREKLIYISILFLCVYRGFLGTYPIFFINKDIENKSNLFYTI